MVRSLPFQIDLISRFSCKFIVLYSSEMVLFTTHLVGSIGITG